MDEITVAVRKGIYMRQKVQPGADAGRRRRSPDLRGVADHYANDPEGLARQSDASRKRHAYDLKFLVTVIV